MLILTSSKKQTLKGYIDTGNYRELNTTSFHSSYVDRTVFHSSYVDRTVFHLTLTIKDCEILAVHVTVVLECDTDT